MYSEQYDLQGEDASVDEPSGLDASPTDENLVVAAGSPSRRQRLGGAMAATATKLLPLVALLDTIQPQVANESVFRTRRKKIRAHFDVVYAELQAERPRHKALAHTFQALTDLVREETRDISKDELKQAAKEVVLATLKNAPALINVAHQARLLA
jgi:hypothetical protein